MITTDSEEESLPVKPELVTEISDPDPTFFDDVTKDVAKTLQKERIQEQYKKVKIMLLDILNLYQSSGVTQPNYSTVLLRISKI